MPSFYAEIVGRPASEGATGTIPGAETLRPAFRTKVNQVAQRLNMDPQHLLAVMSFETGGTFDPAVKNRAGSGATGLIQFMPATARQLGTTTEALARMAPEEQLDYVEQYLKPYAGRMRSQQDAYMAVLYPAALGKPADHVLFQKGTRAYEQNKGLDAAQTGQITIGDTLRTVGRFVRRAITPASAEAAPVSPERAPSGGSGRSFYQDIVGTPAHAPASAPASPPAPASGGPSLYGPMSAPAPSQPPQAPAAQPPQSLIGRLGQAAETAVKGVPIAGQLYPLVKPVFQAQYGEQLEQLPKAGAAGAISAGSAMLGTAAGTYTGIPGMSLVGEMAGSYLGRQLNVGLGLEEPGWKGDVASVAVPPVARGVARYVAPAVTRAAKAVTRRLPGASAAMHEDIAAQLGTAEGNIRPNRPVADFYAEARQHNPDITPSRLHAVAQDIIAAEMRLQPVSRNAELLRLAEGMRDLSLSQHGRVPLQLLDEHRQRLGETVRAWRNRGDTGERQVRRLYGAFHDDMERAANRGVPGAQELRAAIGASRAEHTAEDFLDLFRPGSGGVTVDPQGRIQFHGGKLRTRWNNRLRDDPVFAGGITPQVHQEVDDIITQAQRLERLRPPRGAQYGSGRSLTRAVVGSVAAGPIGTAIAVAGPDVIAAAMQTQRGRAAVRWALQQGGGRINADDLAVIGALVRPAAQEAVTPAGSETGGGPAGP